MKNEKYKKKKLISNELKDDATYNLKDRVIYCKKICSKKFDESIDLSVVLGIDSKKSDQQIRGVISLPKMPPKKVKIAVFADGKDIDVAKKAGAEVVGGEDHD